MNSGKNLHTTTQIPIDDEYAAMVGKAMYAFSYYEWSIIYTIQHLTPSSNYVRSYCRDKGNLTAGDVHMDFCCAIRQSEFPLSPELKRELKKCAAEFQQLIFDRNTLAHAHPITFEGDQILNYQGSSSSPIPDRKWTIEEIERLIADIDEKNKLASQCHAEAKALESS